MSQPPTVAQSVYEEVPTLALLALCYLGFAAASIMGPSLGAGVTVAALAIVLTLHASLQHEVLHGHPFKNQLWNDLLVAPAIGLLIPYKRFKDTHLAHHYDPHLTDPYDDPESNFMDPERWNRLSPLAKRLFDFNNTLAGRIVIGPAVGLWHFYAQDFAHMRQGQRPVLLAYVYHTFSVLAVVAWWVAFANAPFWTLLVAAYCASSILKIRTFLEHRAEEKAAARSVIIEDRGPLALLFLNNNFHSVHHAHPKIVWHKLPAVYRSRRDAFLRRNHGYRYRSYAEIFRQHLFRRKDPVAHPLMRAERLTPAAPEPVPAIAAKERDDAC